MYYGAMDDMLDVHPATNAYGISCILRKTATKNNQMNVFFFCVIVDGNNWMKENYVRTHMNVG